MPGPSAAVAATRVAVRRSLDRLRTVSSDPIPVPGDHGAGDCDATADPAAHAPGPVVVACSGGPDSLALAAATAFAMRRGGPAAAVVIDHGLQPGSAHVAQEAARTCRELGLDPVRLATGHVVDDGRGPEAAARAARYAILERQAADLSAPAVLLGHTRDDQAEQVLLGLSRGSGTRSLSGMAPLRPLSPTSSCLLLRPLLGLTRDQTRRACLDQGLSPWDDPHNTDPRYARVRARRALVALEEALGPGMGEALARSAEVLREDADALDELAVQARAGLADLPWDVGALQRLLPAVRRRVILREIRDTVAEVGGDPGAVTRRHVAAVEALVAEWHGQGPVDLPGGWRLTRSGGRVHRVPGHRG